MKNGTEEMIINGKRPNQKILLTSREDCVEKMRIKTCIVIELGG